MVYITFPSSNPYSLDVRGAIMDAYRACRVDVDSITGGSLDDGDLSMSGKGIWLTCYPLYEDTETDTCVHGEIHVRFEPGSPHQLLFMTVLLGQLGGYITPVAGGVKLYDLNLMTLLDNNLKPEVEAVTEHRSVVFRARMFVR